MVQRDLRRGTFPRTPDEHRIGTKIGLAIREYVTGTEVINEKSREAMRAALKRIQTGEYAKMFIQEGKTNYPSMTARRRLNAEHPVEVVGEKLRAMMPWIAKNKLVDQTRN